MRERLGALRNRLGFAELASVGVLVLSFLIGGVIGGTPVTILPVCSGFNQAACEARIDVYIALNPATGLLAVALAIVALLVLDRILRRRDT
jgi:hypothetical protein